jgi:putative transposase
MPIMARPCRIPNYPYVGEQRYFLTICTQDRATFFVEDHIVYPVIDRFLQTAREHSMAIIVYCVMPDHMHLLVDGESDDADLKRFAKLAKQSTGFWFKQGCGKRLWQKGYYEHVLRDEERTEDVILYIIANPVRKHLVEQPLDYPYWGSSIYSREDLLRSIGLKSQWCN